MKLSVSSPAKVLNKAYLKQSLDAFLTSKIIYPDIAQSPKFLMDESSSFSSNTTYFVPSSDYCLLGLLNSKLIWWFYGTITSSILGGFVLYFSQYMEQLSIPHDTDAQKSLATPVVPQLEAEIDRLVYELYGLTEEEIAVVELKQ